MSGDTSALNAPAIPQGGMQQVASTTPSGGGMIQADASSNTLIVTASEPVYNNIRSVIEKLDVRRPQIFVNSHPKCRQQTPV
jgi:general secretion pathway protein D